MSGHVESHVFSVSIQHYEKLLESRGGGLRSLKREKKATIRVEELTIKHPTERKW